MVANDPALKNKVSGTIKSTTQNVKSAAVAKDPALTNNSTVGSYNYKKSNVETTKPVQENTVTEEKTTLGDRLLDMLKSTWNTAAGATKASAAMSLNTAKDLDDAVNNQKIATKNAASRVDLYQSMADNATSADDKKRYQMMADNAKRAAGIIADENSAYNSHPLNNAIEKTTTSALSNYQKSNEYAESAREGLGKVGSTIVDAVQTTANMAAPIAVGALTGGVGGAIATGLQSGGNAYLEKLASGSNEKQARAYGSLIGLLESATSALIGGIAKTGGKLIGSSPIEAKISAMDAGLKKGAAYLAYHNAAEINEEEVQLFLEPLVNKIIYGGDYDAPTIEDMVYTAIVTGLSTSALNARPAIKTGRTQANTASDNAITQAFSDTQNNTQNESNLTVENNTAQNAVKSVTEAQTKQVTPQTIFEIIDKSKNGRADLNKVDANSLDMKSVETSMTSGEVAMDSDGKLYRVNPSEHIDNRQYGTVSERSLNAFQFDHPDLHNYYAETAKALYDDLQNSERGGETVKIPAGRAIGDDEYIRTSRAATAEVAELLDDANLSYNDIAKALDAIINNHGQENYAAAKKVEVMLDKMLTNGYRTSYGEDVAPNAAYIQAKSEIAGSQDTANVSQNDSLGSAMSGFETPNSKGTERTSNIASTSVPFNQYEGFATGLNKVDYNELFRYTSQTEAQSMQKADNLLYVEQDGQRKFIKDVDEQSYKDIVEYLTNAPAWNAQMVDAAFMIKRELQQRSLNMEITETEYTDWLKQIREHDTETGRGVQANVKWSRGNNDAGQSTELDAWENIENSDLSEAEKAERFNRIVQWDIDIEKVAENDSNSMIDIIMDVAGERGVLNNAITGKESKTFSNIVRKSLNSLTFKQLKQFAYQSTSALSTDANKVNFGQKVKTVQVLNMLSAPKTTGTNLTGNTSFYGIDAMSMRGAAILDMAISKITGTRSVAFEKSALSRESVASAAKAMKMSIAEVSLDVDMGGEGRYGTSSNRTFKASGNILERVLSSCERNMGYLLTTTDELYKGAARSTKNATQSLIENGKIKTDENGYAENRSNELAKYRTFQDDGIISTAIQQIHDVLNLVGIGDSGKRIGKRTVRSFGVGDLTAPFTRVAGNLVSRGVEYSPFGAAKGTVELIDVVAKAAKGSTNAANQARAVSDFARGMSGTAIAYGFIQLVKAGLLRRADDENDSDVAALNKAEGMTGTQFNLSAAKRLLSGGSAEWQYGDTLIDLSSIEPLNLIMNLGVQLANDEERSIVSVFGDTVDATKQSAADLPVLQTVGNTAKNIFKYGMEPVEAIREQLADTIISSLVPNAVSSLAKGLDEKQRNIYTGDTFTDYLVDVLKNKTPVVRETLPTSTNTLGEERKYQGDTTQRIINSMFSPIGVNSYLQGDVSKELERVRKSTGKTDFYPSNTIPKEVSTGEGDNKKVYELTYEQRQAYQKKRGTETNSTMQKMIASSAYKKANDSTKAELLKQCYDYGNEMAKADVIGFDNISKKYQNAYNAKKDIGISTEEWLARYNEYDGGVLESNSYKKTKEAINTGMSLDDYSNMKASANTNGNSGINKDEAMAWLDKKYGNDRNTKRMLWNIVCTTNANNPY